MRKSLIITLGILLMLSVSQTFAQSVDPIPEKHSNTLEYLQGTGVYDNGVMVFLKGLKDSIWTHFGDFIGDAKALAAIFMIIFFSIKSYEMMSGDKQMEIMPLLRPFGLVMVILWWGVFVKVLAFPTDLVAIKTEEMFESEQKQINDLRFIRADYIVAVMNSMYTFQASTEVASKESDSFFQKSMDVVTSPIKEKITNVIAPIVELKNRFAMGIQLFVTQLLELLSLWLLRIAVYIVFIIQIIYSSILIILGPFAVAASILPAYRDSFSTWVARFISVSLYAGIAYFIMFIMALFQKYALLSEISKYKALIKVDGVENNIAKMASFASNGILSFGTVIIVFIIGAICMFTVPSISTWIISTSGISSAASNFGRGSGTLMNAATKTVKKLL